MLRSGILLLYAPLLFAEGMDEAALEGIHTEALWFVAVIAVMSVVSFVVSRRNAQKYEEKMRQQKAQQQEKEAEVSVAETEVVEPQTDVLEVDRLLELSKLHKEGLLSYEEFMAFKTKLYKEIKEAHVQIRP